MKRILFLLIVFTFFYSHSQVGIGTTTPSDAAMLEVSSQTPSGDFKGMMPPRVPTNVDRDAINPQATDIGLLVFVMDTGCLNIWNGTSWEDIHCISTTASLDVWINEFHYDNIGVDTGEFIEIVGTAGLDLTGYSIVRYNGSTGAPYGTNNFSGILTDDTGTGYGFAVITYANGLQNGNPDGFALVDNTGTVVQFLSYEGFFTAVGGAADGLISTDIGVIQTGDATLDPIGASLQLSGTGSTFTDFTWTSTTTNTSDNLNTGQIIN